MRHRLFVIGWALASCHCHPCDVEALDYAPVDRADAGGWAVSTPEAEGLPADLVQELFCEAQREDTLYGLLVAKNGVLVAEQYFHEGSIDEAGNRQSVTKSYTSALVGLALREGCLDDVDQPMLDFFPELVDDIEDPRKHEITVRHLLEMRAGYPWEESDPALFDLLLTGDYDELVRDVPLMADPGTEHHYSNLTSHWLGMVVARACETDLRTFAEAQLFTPLGAEIGGWTQDVDGYYLGFTEIGVTARDMARFGQLYLDEGLHGGEPLIPADWVRDSLRRHSDDPGHPTPGPTFSDWGYGYQWWSATAGPHEVRFAWGHGGQFIFLVDALDLVVVVVGDPFYLETSTRQWRNERGHLNLVGRFLRALPTTR